MDVSITMDDDSGHRRNMLVDVAIASPFARDVQGVPGKAAKNAELAKCKKYANIAVVPAIWETLGAPGQSVISLLRKLAPQGDPGERTAWMGKAWRVLGTTLQTHSARIVRTACHGRRKA